MAETQQLTPEQQDVAKKLAGALNSGSFESVFTAQEVVSAIKMFVDVGEKPRDILMRADFADDEQATAGTRHAAKCREFHDQIGLEEFHETVAARTSIGGKRTDILLRGITGGQQGGPQGRKPGMNEWVKRKAGMSE